MDVAEQGSHGHLITLKLIFHVL